MDATGKIPGTEAASVASQAAAELWRDVSGSVLDLMPAAVYVCDTEGVIVWYNRRAAEIWGRSPRIGDTDRKFCGSLRLFRPDGRPLPHHETPMAEVLQTGKPARDEEVTIERPDGTLAFVLVNIDPLRDAAGHRIGAVNCFIDITERRTLERDLEDFFENSGVALHCVASDGTILRANRAELELLGYTADEYIGHYIAEFHTDPSTIDDMLARLGRGEEIENYEARLRAKDGSIRHVLVTSNAQFRDGEFVHTRCFTTDITERRDLQERLLLAQEVGGVGTFERDFTAGTMRVSRKYWQLFGVEPDSFPLTYEGWLSRVHPNDHERIAHDIDAALETGRYETEFRVTWPNGEVHWLHTRGLAEAAPDGRPLRVSGAIVDVTEQKTAEQALRQQEVELRRVTDSIPALVSYVDARQHFRLANRAYVEWFGRPREEIEGRHIRDVLGEAAYETIRPQVEKVLSGKPVRYDSRRVLPDGSERQVDASYVPRFGRRNGRVIGFYAFVNDMTERNRTMAELRARTALLETVLDVVPAAVWVSEDRDGSVIFGSRYAAQLFRVPPEQNLSRTPRDGKGPTHWWFRKNGAPLAIGESPLRRSLRGEIVRGEELDLVYDDGGHVTLLMHSAPILDAAGKPEGAVSAAMDITRRVRTHEALRARTAELEAIMETVPAIVWLARGRDADYIERSRYGAELLRVPRSRDWSGTAPEVRMPDHFRMLRNGTEVPVPELPLRRAARGEDVREEEIEILFDDGDSVPVLINASPLHDETGRIIGSLGAGIDIRERKRAEERQRLLTAELDHRVKNMLATVQAIIARTADGRRSASEFATSLNGRIRAMARAHEQLAENRWEGIGLRTLVGNELQPYTSERRTSIEGPELVLSAKAATSLALVLHELSTNAVKYGALSRDRGMVSVTWQLGPDPVCGPARTLRLSWVETGGPPVAEPGSRGFGSVLIERIVAYEFDAQVSLQWAPEGLRATLDIPLSKIAAQERHATIRA